MIEVSSRDVSDAVERAVSKLARTEKFVGHTLVSMPVIYPSGASVTLEISGEFDRFFASDRAGGYFESELIGAQRIYGREATRTAASFGIKFDGRNMFVAETGMSNLPAVMKIVSHCSQLAANICAMKLSEKIKSDVTESLYERLVSVFTEARVARDVEVAGASTHDWSVSARVAGARHSILFDAVSPQPTSAVWTAAKCGDIARLESPPHRVAVVRSRQLVGNMIGVISPSATAIIELTASNDAFLRLEAA